MWRPVFSSLEYLFISVTEIFIVNLVSTPTNVTSCDYTSISLVFFYIMEIEKLGVESVAWQLSTSESLGHREGMLPRSRSMPVGANWENIVTDHGRYWV